jgi:hypothetical protein
MGGGSEIYLPAFTISLNYESFASKAEKKKNTVKEELAELILARNELEKKLVILKKEVKYNREHLKNLKAELFSQQNKLHLIKTECVKVDRQKDALILEKEKCLLSLQELKRMIESKELSM